MPEIVDIVNEDDEVIGQRSRKEVHSSNEFIHRTVHVFVLNAKGEVLLQKRSMKKDKYPGLWGDMAGHINAGDGYEDTAKREMEEELGIDAASIQLEFMMKFRKRFDNDQEIITLFKCVHEGPFKHDPEEVDEVKFFSAEQVKELLEKGNVAPGARIALEEWLKQKGEN
jgi:isopentenyl-diphosphate delta-isomerase type 1